MADISTKLGIYDLRGPAVDRLRSATDDNHADDADEARALANFERFSESFLKTQLKFLDDLEKRS